jgi:hypothetical protein
MLGKGELEKLQLQKNLLVLQSDTNRLLLFAEWQKLRSPETWMNEAGSLARHHPIWTAILSTAAGAFVIRALRKPAGVAGGFGRLGTFASLAFTAWKLFKKYKAEP